MSRECILNVRLKPQAKRDSVTVDEQGTVTIAVTAPPVEGRANARAIQLLSSALRVPKSACSIVRGQKTRTKLMAVDGIGKQNALAVLKADTRRSHNKRKMADYESITPQTPDSDRGR